MASPGTADMPAASDAESEVLARLGRGDRRGALALLMSEHGAAIWGYCLRTLRDRSLADDVQQQVFLEAYRDLDRFAGRSSLRSWLFGIAHHRCLDAIKTRRRRDARFDLSEPAEVSEIAAASPRPDEAIDRDDRVRALEACLAALSPEVRRTVLMRFQSGEGYDQLARVLGDKPGTLQARVARALPALRRCLERKGIAP